MPKRNRSEVVLFSEIKNWIKRLFCCHNDKPTGQIGCYADIKNNNKHRTYVYAEIVKCERCGRTKYSLLGTVKK
jgi:hypothetical protein